MYDIGCLCDKADNPEIVAAVFSSFAKTELAYRKNKSSVDDVLDDIIDMGTGYSNMPLKQILLSDVIKYQRVRRIIFVYWLLHCKLLAGNI